MLGSVFSYLDHVNEVVEILSVVDGQLVVLIDDSIVDDLSGDTDAQDIITGMADRLSHQEQAVFGWLQLTHRLWTRDLPMKPAEERKGQNEPHRQKKNPLPM